jgi:hypothetical protein
LKNIYIRAFRAIDDSAACLKFIEGHKRVLDIVGVNEVTSSNNEWMTNPNVYVILIESGDRSQVYGGSRVHIADGSHPLPLEEATSDIDIKVAEVVKRHLEKGTGEICGLWNSLEVAGYGIGSTYAIRSAICILPQIKLKTCFALCSPYTARIASNYGFKIERSLGNDGTFYYPKIDLLATITFVENTELLEDSSHDELEIIKSLREFPSQEKVEIGPKGEVQVTYDLSLGSI